MDSILFAKLSVIFLQFKDVVRHVQALAYEAL